jgi:hypothetical protein
MMIHASPKYRAAKAKYGVKASAKRNARKEAARRLR